MPARINKIVLTSGDSISTAKNLTVLVGPNNVGKSVLLNSLHSLMQQVAGSPPLNAPVVASVEATLPPEPELIHKLESAGSFRSPGQYPQGHFAEAHYLLPVNGQVLTTGQLRQLYNGNPNAAPTFSYVAALLLVIMQPESRLGQLAQVGTPNLLVEDPQAPLQILFKDRSLEAKLSAYAQRAFGINLTVNRHAGSQITLHVGEVDADEPAIGVLTDYQRQLVALPMAANQGHGVQAFLGILIILVARAFDIVLIDEPEAFLHPPQARLLGELFVELSRQGTQVIVSTHSDDFLQGVLTASASAGGGHRCSVDPPKSGNQ